MKLLLDANILFHKSLSSFFCFLHESEYLNIHLSKRIIDEWKINYGKYLNGLGLEDSFEIINTFVLKYPNVVVSDYEKLAKDIKLFDTNDHHVLQAAIKCRANYIITYNTKDFPKSKLRPLGIKAISPHAYFNEISNDVDLLKLASSFVNNDLDDQNNFNALKNLKIDLFEKLLEFDLRVD